MRLSDVLSKPPSSEYMQVDSFLVNKKGNTGQQINLSVGQVALNYFCSDCRDLRTFSSKGTLTCIFVNRHIVSIDCVLTCHCGTNVQVWFLVECEDDITSTVPKIRIMKRSQRLSDKVRPNNNQYGEFSVLLDKAEQAYRESLGAGSIVYLRQVFEKVTIQTAELINLEYAKYDNGTPKNFSDLLKKVDEQCSIIPREFSCDRYRLFQELSSIVHGGYNEELGLQKFESLHRLVVGILENMKNSKELTSARKSLGWIENGGNHE